MSGQSVEISAVIHFNPLEQWTRTTMLYRNTELEVAILKYANWINSNNITFEYIEENTSHPLRVERSSCLKMGLELDQMIN